MFMRAVKEATVTKPLEQYFYNCIRFQDHYICGTNKHNRAVIFIFASFYEWMRSKGGADNDTTIGGFTNAPKLDEKIHAVRLFRRFLASDYPLNKFNEYVTKELATDAYSSEEKAAITKAITDSSTSKLMCLLQLALDVCTADFYRKPVV